MLLFQRMTFPKKTVTLLMLVGLLTSLVFIDTSRTVKAETFVASQINDGNIRDGEIVVQVDAAVLDSAAFAAATEKIAEEVIEMTDADDAVPGFNQIKLKNGVNVEVAIQALKQVPGVLYAGPQVIYRASLIPNDTDFGSQWALNNTGQVVNSVTGTPDADIDAPEAWDVTTGSAAITVAVVDSGVQFEHSELSGRVWANPEESSAGVCTFDSIDNDFNGFVDDCRGADFVSSFAGSGSNAPRDNDPSPCGTDITVADALDTGDCNGIDDNGDGSPDNLIAHGTHVAGIIAATQGNAFGISGVAPSVSIMPVRALTEDGIGTTTDVIDAMNYALNEGAHIVNMSFGSDIFDLAFNAVVASAEAKNVVLVAAAGNANENIIVGMECDSPVCNDDPNGTGANNVLSVAATTNQDRKAGFSNYSTSGFIDVAAPGNAILSTCYDTPSSASCITGSNPPGEFASMSGTSQAAPHAAGVAALLRSAFPALSATQVMTVIRLGGDDIDAPNSGLAACGGLDCTTGPKGTIGLSRLNAYGAFAPRLISASPNSGTRITNGLTVALTGINTNFGPTSQVSFGPGIDIPSFSCSSTTACTAVINITGSVPLGPHEVTITTGAEVVKAPALFTVTDAILRLSGATRIGTAVAVSQNGFPASGSADAVVISRSNDFPDSLAGATLASLANGPLLLNPSNSFDPQVSAELQRVLDPTIDPEPDIYILGQTAAISAGVEAGLAALNPNWQVKRIGGANRSQTATMIADELHILRSGPPTQVFIATQNIFADALAAGVPASDPTIDGRRIPILLTDKNNLSTAAREYLATYAASIKTVYIVGGVNAVSGNVHIQIASIIPGVTRLSGVDRYATASTISEFFYKNPTSMSVASGLNFPDAMVGNWHSGMRSSPMLLIRNGTAPQATIDYMNGHKSTLLGGYMYGGPAVISDNVKTFLETLL
jgi:subtilisin family serine protease/putative cell wall-binding protein